MSPTRVLSTSGLLHIILVNISIPIREEDSLKLLFLLLILIIVFNICIVRLVENNIAIVITVRVLIATKSCSSSNIWVDSFTLLHLPFLENGLGLLRLSWFLRG